MPIHDKTNIEMPMNSGVMNSGSLSERSGSHRNETPRNSIVFWNTKYSAKRIGIGNSIGRQPSTGVKGLMPCS